ncbi:DNA-binding protein [Paenarthrobacter ureafaciens]|uniref:DNA-binding protein n=1 Tax=Paenarthrobacter ureafaciens TaxID=37931 RepID=UPI0009AEF499|nr:DNA-binding protein [Paenarthrobacter ureafaciens]MEC3853918.1 DNA-binding protein [Paenarthrobacter ureafaciens]GLU61677.1 hypothetical protein Pure01_41900 [Paenarthrobacter ureafaciens]GLU65948.1 hypothetical protein Pure02_41980 [Paenarthrobacter ureafaciens]GLU69318.1 hypothetical protein Pure03_32940 [Paenarthrobacter ureafaciens]GLU73679.1 hypothetical protein Pure04_33940 [Paenarthrobacter ureafaciens]
MSLSVKDRVYAAAEEISAERRPTVSTVRAAAGVSNADATRYLKEWNEERQAAGGQVAATPPLLLEAAARLAGASWAEAVSQANERHAAVEALWAQERRDKDEEISELVADLDAANAEKDVTATAHAEEVARLQEQHAGLERRVAELGQQLEDALNVQRATAAEAADSARAAAIAEARAATLEQAHNALLARISPETGITDK